MPNPRTDLRKKNGQVITVEVTLQNALDAFSEALEVVANKNPTNEDLQQVADQFRILFENVDWQEDISVMTTQIAF